MLSALIGLLVMAASLWGIFRWWQDFLLVLRGFIPLCFFFGGLVAVIAGLSSLGAKGAAQTQDSGKK